MKKTFITLAIGSATALSGAYYQQDPQGFYQQGQPYDQGQYYYQGQGNQWQQQGQPYNQGQANFQNPQNPNQRINVQWTEQPGSQNNTQGRQGSSQDREIEKKIGETVTSGWFSNGYNTISYQVNNGKVILKGIVDTEENKSHVEDSVSRLPGVISVDNQIRVVAKPLSGAYDAKTLNESERKYPNDTTTTESDRQINAKIREKLSRWMSNGYNDAIILRTDNGLVIVVGTVKNSDDIQKVVDQIKKVEGVRKISTQLSVQR